MAEDTEKSSSQPLDEIMLAMDVVDTLRHQQLLVERELNTENRDQKMLQRLHEIYASQGIEVPEHVLEQGVTALREGRFTYTAPASGIASALARLYVSRANWGKPVLLAITLSLLVWLAYALLIKGPGERASAALPQQLQSSYENLIGQAKGETARQQSESLLLDGQSALQRNREDKVETILQQMASLQRDIELEYELRIAAHPGTRSGVWRIPDANTGARNYYIIVEAVNKFGKLEDVPVVNEEDGKTYRVQQWGLRVEEPLFRQVAADKSDDGIVQNNRFGSKKRGFLTPDYVMPTTGAAITQW